MVKIMAIGCGYTGIKVMELCKREIGKNIVTCSVDTDYPALLNHDADCKFFVRWKFDCWKPYGEIESIVPVRNVAIERLKRILCIFDELKKV